jgi:hypothetical protein
LLRGWQSNRSITAASYECLSARSQPLTAVNRVINGQSRFLQSLTIKKAIFIVFDDERAHGQRFGKQLFLVRPIESTTRLASKRKKAKQ